MDDDFSDFEGIEAVTDDGFDNSDLGVAAPDDDDMGVDFSRHETESTLNAEFSAFHNWYEQEFGESYDYGYLPEELIERFNNFDMEQGRHLSLVESAQRVVHDTRRSEWEESEFLAGFNEE